MLYKIGRQIYQRLKIGYFIPFLISNIWYLLFKIFKYIYEEYLKIILNPLNYKSQTFKPKFYNIVILLYQ